jgi:peptidoglycan/LPS O-acetylase OafA/YrhL
VAQVDLDLPRAAAFGVPAGCLVAACGLGHAHKLAEESWPVRIGTILGDSSYALYLIHPFVIRGMRQALQRLAPHLPEAPSLLIGLGLMAAFAASVLVFRFVERPLTRLVRAGLERRRIVAEP